MVSIEKGIELCRVIYNKLSPHGFYPSLTGGLLYKDGQRKDIDIVIYRNRQQAPYEMEGIEELLSKCGLSDFNYYGFVTKAKWQGFTVDLFNPESEGDYVNGDVAKAQVAAVIHNHEAKKIETPPPAPTNIQW